MFSFHARGWWWSALSVVFVSCGSTLPSVAAEAAPGRHPSAPAVWVTWRGAEADKGASAWFLTRFVRRDLKIREVEPGQLDIGAGEPFDVPQANFRRRHQSSVYEQLLQTYPVEDATVGRLGEIIHDIEINLWRPKQFPESVLIQKAALEFAAKRGDNWIPLNCYMAWFDAIYSQMSERGALNSVPDFPSTCAAKK